MFIEDVVALEKVNMVKIISRRNVLYLEYIYEKKRVRKSTKLEDNAENRKLLNKSVIPTLISKIITGDMRKSNEENFDYYYEKYLLFKQHDKSYSGRKYVFEKVNAHFKDFAVKRISRLMVKEYLASLKLKSSSKKDYLYCIKGVLDIALDDDVLDRNVAVGIKFKREPKPEVQLFAPDEVLTLLNEADGMFKSYLGIAFLTGMRSGEIIGLMKSDIREDRICVRRSISKGSITTPKTIGSVRDIPIMQGIEEFIRERLVNSAGLYLFEIDSKPLYDSTYFKKQWHKLIEKTGLIYRKLYCTRHTFITAMLNAERYKIMEIARMVGHTSPEMIMKNYAGFIKDAHLKIQTDIDIFGTNPAHLKSEDINNEFQKSLKVRDAG